MFAKTAKQLAVHLEENQIIKSDDRELYVYGLNQGLSILLNIGTTLGIGLLFGTVSQLVVFMVAYIPLRSYAGGYHARTPLRCYVISIIMLIVVSMCLKCIELNHRYYWALVVVSFFFIIFLSPIADKNKPLDEIEVRVYRKRAIFILLVEVVLSVLFATLHISHLLSVMLLVFITMSSMLVIGCVKNKLNAKRISSDRTLKNSKE